MEFTLNILALETSARYCQVALHCNDSTISRREDITSHSNLILTFVDQLLNEGSIAVEQLDCIAVVRGPGSFTGLRVGIAVAQGLAFAHSIPVIPLSSLQLTAWEWCRKIGPWKGDVAVLSTLDARMSQIYACWYLVQCSGSASLSVASGLYPLGSEQLVSPRLLAQLQLPVCVDGVTKLQASSRERGDIHGVRRVIVGSGLSYELELDPEVAAQCELQRDISISTEGMIDWVKRLRHGELEDAYVAPQDLAPVYIRDNVVG